jgi:hypothetical protein
VCSSDLLSAISDGIRIVEPVIQINTAGTVDLTSFACRFPSATIASQSFSLAANNLSLDLQPHFVVAGTAGYRADLARLMSYVPSQSTQQLSGTAAGRLQLQAQEHTTSFRLSGEVENFRVDNASNESAVWREPKLTLNVAGSYDAIRDRLELTDANIVGQVVNLAARGTASQLTTRPTVDFEGQYGYDLAGLTAIFGDMIGSDIRLDGKQQQRFAMRGPLFPESRAAKDRVSNELVAQASVGWDTATVYNVPLGAAQVDARLANGLLQFRPLQIAVGDGRVQLTPSIHVNTEPLWLTIEPQTIAEQIRLTPEMTSTWIKYIAPLLADATNVEGTFSVSLDRAEIPLMQPMAGQVDGKFIVHGGAIGLGPLARQFIDLASQIKQLLGRGDSRITDPSKTWVELAPQEVTFQLADNRVYHEGFEMLIDGIPIRTRGSVGIIDESISVMAEVPILDEWVASTPALAGLKGQLISIPVGGTTSKPQLDRRALSQVSGQLAQSAARGYVQQQFDNKLQEKWGDTLQGVLGGQLQDVLGGGSKGEAGRSAREKVGRSLQYEIGNQLNRLLK